MSERLTEDRLLSLWQMQLEDRPVRRMADDGREGKSLVRGLRGYAAVAKKFDQGVTVEEIARRYGFTLGTITDYYKRWIVAKERAELGAHYEILRAEVRALRHKSTIKVMAELFQLSEQTIRAMMK